MSLNKYSKEAAAIVLATGVTFGIRHCEGKKEIEGVRDVIADIERTSFETMVPDHVLEQLIQKLLRDASQYGNELTYTAHLEAISDVMEEQLYDKTPEGKGVDEIFSGTSLGSIINEGRHVILDKAKEHLSDPKNLWSFYLAKKPIILKELRKASDGDLAIHNMKNWLKGVKNALDGLKVPALDTKYKNYIEAERRLVQTCVSLKNPFAMPGEAYAENGPYDPTCPDSLMNDFNIAERNLEDQTPDLDATLFFLRRMQENPRILETYSRILDDMLVELDSIQNNKDAIQ